MATRWSHLAGKRHRAVRAGNSCDLDHTQPWPAGPTCSCNLSPLCRRHHRMKTLGRIVLEPSTDPTDPPGTLWWRLPSGRRYTSRPDPMIIDSSHYHRPPPAPEPPAPPAPTPMVDLGLLARPRFGWGTVCATLAMFSMLGLLFVLPLYLQAVRGHDPLGTGVRLLPMIAGLVVGAKAGEAATVRLGARIPIVAGL